MDSTAFRYTFPEWTATIFGESPGDINPMNNGMRYGLVWDLAPRHYNDSVDEQLTRPLAKYVSELIRIRKQYEDLLFFGRFNDMLGATVQGGPDIRYSVFKSMESEQPGCRKCHRQLWRHTGKRDGQYRWSERGSRRCGAGSARSPCRSAAADFDSTASTRGGYQTGDPQIARISGEALLARRFHFIWLKGWKCRDSLELDRISCRHSARWAS